MISEKQILDFYNSKKFNPYLPEHSNWYHFRVRCTDGIFRRIPVTINSRKKLQRWLIKEKAADVYFSTSLWLDPKKIRYKDLTEGYLVANKLLLGHKLYFDIDEDYSLEGLEKARKTALQVIEYMKEKDFELDYLCFTGNKGFALCYSAKEDILPANALERIAFIEKNRKFFIKVMPKSIKIDAGVLIDAMRIRRLPGTVHSSTGYICSLLTQEELNKPIKELLNHCCDFITRERPGIPAMGNDRDPLVLKDKKEDGTGPTSSFNFITNEVIGTKTFVPILKYEENQNWENDIRKLQEQYMLGQMYVLENNDKIYAVSLKAMQPRRLKKVIFASKCSNKKEFDYFGKIFMRFDKETSFVKTILSELSGDISKGHKDLFEKWSGEDYLNIGNLAGDGMIRQVMSR